MEHESQDSRRPTETTPLRSSRSPSHGAGSWIDYLHRTLESNAYNWLLFLGVLVNLVGFLLSTQEEPPVGLVADWVVLVDTVSAGWFLLDYVARIITSSKRGHKWRSYMFCDIYAYIDLVSFLPYFLDLLVFRRDAIISTQWMKTLRLFYPLQKQYLGFNFFSTIFTSNAGLLLTSGFCGFTVWVICGSLYYYFEQDNDAMIYCPDGGNHKETCYNRFHSIPSAMYFSLLNFFGEYPLVHSHRGGGAVVALFVQIVGVAVVSIPAGIFGSAFEDVVQKHVGAATDDEEEEERVSSGIIGVLNGNRGRMMLPLPFMQVDAGFAWREASSYLAILSCAHAVFSSLPMTSMVPLARWALEFLAMAYASSVIIFFGEWLLRIRDVFATSNNKYALFGAYHLIDILAWMPQLLLVLCPYNLTQTLQAPLRMLRVCVIFKLERFQRAFTKFDKILKANGAIFVVTGYVAFVCWLFFSTLMYYVERDNPDVNIRKYYTSVFTSMWITLLNLTGQMPLCDYSVCGRWVTGMMGLIAVGIVTIPMGVLGNGFQEWLDGTNTEDSAMSRTLSDTFTLSSESGPKWVREEQFLTMQERVFRFVQGSRARNASRKGIVGEVLIFFCIGICAVCAILETVEGYAPPKSVTASIFSKINAVCVGIFSVEYLLRLYAAPLDPYYKRHGYTQPMEARVRFVIGPLSLVDLLAILPFFMAAAGSDVADRYDGELRMLRVLRLVTLDAYVPSLSLIGRVLKTNWGVLRLAGYATMCLWLLFAGLLYWTEHADRENVARDITMSERYRTILSALPYTVVHLSGSFPLVDYTYSAKAVLAVALVIATGVVAVPAGILAGGYSTELLRYRQEQREARRNAPAVLEQALMSYVYRKRLRKVVRGAVAQAREHTRLAQNAERENRFVYKAYVFIEKESVAGRFFAGMVVVLIIGNVTMVMLESIKPPLFSQAVFDVFEAVSVLVFTVDFSLRLWSASCNKNLGCSRWRYASSVMGVVDVLAILPWWIEMGCILLAPHLVFNNFIFRIFRIVRIVQLEKFVHAFTVLNNVWCKAKDSLVSTLFIALLVWVVGSCLFFAFEQNNPRMEGAFKDLPSSMYYTGLFLGGTLDFTPAGMVVCILYYVAGIAILSLPVGSVFEAFGDALKEECSESTAGSGHKA